MPEHHTKFNHPDYMYFKEMGNAIYKELIEPTCLPGIPFVITEVYGFRIHEVAKPSDQFPDSYRSYISGAVLPEWRQVYDHVWIYVVKNNYEMYVLTEAEEHEIFKLTIDKAALALSRGNIRLNISETSQVLIPIIPPRCLQVFIRKNKENVMACFSETIDEKLRSKNYSMVLPYALPILDKTISSSISRTDLITNACGINLTSVGKPASLELCNGIEYFYESHIPLNSFKRPYNSSTLDPYKNKKRIKLDFCPKTIEDELFEDKNKDELVNVFLSLLASIVKLEI